MARYKNTCRTAKPQRILKRTDAYLRLNKAVLRYIMQAYAGKRDIDTNPFLSFHPVSDANLPLRYYFYTQNHKLEIIISESFLFRRYHSMLPNANNLISPENHNNDL